MSEEALAILVTLKEKLKEADQVRPLQVGASKVTGEAHSIACRSAEQCAKLHFTSTAAFAALSKVRDESGLNSQAKFPSTLLQAMIKACHSRGIDTTFEDLKIGDQSPE